MAQPEPQVAWGGYNYFYIDAGDQVAVFNGEYRSSLVVDPPDGRFPPLTRAAQEARQEAVARRAEFGEYDNPENRPLGERCIKSFGSNAGPPMLPTTSTTTITPSCRPPITS